MNFPHFFDFLFPERPIKFPLDPEAPSIILPVTLKNVSLTYTAEMILDTGASLTVLRPSIASALHLSLQTHSSPIITAAGSIKTSFTTIPKVTVLNQTKSQIQAIITELPKETPIGGLLGLSFLKYYRLDLNFRRLYLTLT